MESDRDDADHYKRYIATDARLFWKANEGMLTVRGFHRELKISKLPKGTTNEGSKKTGNVFTTFAGRFKKTMVSPCSIRRMQRLTMSGMRWTVRAP